MPDNPIDSQPVPAPHDQPLGGQQPPQQPAIEQQLVEQPAIEQQVTKQQPAQQQTAQQSAQTGNLLNLAVVGHTNTGKTSLLRTLLRSQTFGEVSNQAATTRHVEAAMLNIAGQDVAQLFDTPGMEDGSGLLEWLETETPRHFDGIERIWQFLDAPVARGEFSQEAKVIRQALASDALLYVIDAREPVLARYRDELTVLSFCARPVLPVMNFVRPDNQHATHVAAWQEALARRNLHAMALFDTVAFSFAAEMSLWNSLKTLLPLDSQKIDTLRGLRVGDWEGMIQQALKQIADMLLDVGAMQRQVHEDTPVEPEQTAMQQKVRQREAQLQQSLLGLYRFYQEDVNADGELAADTSWQADPFDPELLRRIGIKSGGGAAAGAAIGATFDLMVGAVSLGAGTVLGGLIGGLSPHASKLMDKAKGYRTLRVGEGTLTLLAARNLQLLRLLLRRGHADQGNIRLLDAPIPWKDLPKPLDEARHEPGWSRLNDGFRAGNQRQQAVARLADTLGRRLDQQQTP